MTNSSIQPLQPRSWQRRTAALAKGVTLHPSIPPMLAARGQAAGIAVPVPLPA